MRWLGKLFDKPTKTSRRRLAGRRSRRLEKLESREVFAADVLPVLMVLADQQDFYYQEYNDTKLSLEAAGLDVVVAATTTNTTVPHPNSGQQDQSGAVTPDLALSDVDPANYSAIVFVGGWGASQYQYAFNDPNLDGTIDNYYDHQPYNGDNQLYDGQIATQKVIVNNLINDFLAEDKYVAAICHGVTVLAWARVDGVSPLAGKQVAVPTTVSSPSQFYNGQWRTDGYYMGQYDQVIANGAIASAVSGNIGDPDTAADDVVVDGRIITGENYDSASMFGQVIAQQILAAAPPVNQTPIVVDATWAVPEHAPLGTILGQVQATDHEPGQSHVFSIVQGNDSGAFEIDPATGIIRVANFAAMDFETSPSFTLLVAVTDSGTPPQVGFAEIVINLTDVAEGPFSVVGNDLVVQGTAAADTIYLWSDSSASTVHAWVNGERSGPIVLGAGGRVIVFSGSGNDQVFATDLRVGATIYGEAGHDLITGGSAGDLIYGGAGVDRLTGGLGDDIIHGGEGNDYLYGREGNNVLIGDSGNDYLEGHNGFDLLIGGDGSDLLRGGGGDDLLIGGTTSYDANDAALLAMMALWTSPGTTDTRIASLSDPLAAVRLQQGDTVHDDGQVDTLVGGASADWYFAAIGDLLYANDASDRVSA